MQAYQFFTIESIPHILKRSFEYLPPDLWLKPEDGSFRFRCYQQAILKDQHVSYLKSDVSFFQPEHLNCYSGGIQRKYNGLMPEIANIVLDSIVSLVIKTIPNKEYQIGIHQIRITTDSLNVGYPAPEGIHQDGFTYIFVCCIGISNISGGGYNTYTLSQR